jgi:protein SDA1
MYEAHREIFLQAPSSATDTGITSFRELVDFIAHVADCYPSLTKKFPEDLIDIISHHHQNLGVELRSKIVGSLALLKRKEIIDSSKFVSSP